MIQSGEKMSELKLIPVKPALLFSLSVFVFLANTSSAVEISIETGGAQITDIMNKAVSSPIIEDIVSTTKYEVTIEKIKTKPLLNDVDFMPQGGVMPMELGGEERVEVEKEMRQPENMNVVRSALSAQLAPQF